MKVAFLIDCESLGGGCEYIRQKSDERRQANDACRTFYSVKGECTPATLDAWGADDIVVNHLKALVQLLRNPFRRPKGRVTFVIHGIHLRGCTGLRRFLRRRLERWLYHRCDRIVALTETDRSDILRLYGADLRVDVEPNTLAGWTPNLAEGLPPGIEGPFDYICIGRFCHQKGQDRWIERCEGRDTRDESTPVPRTSYPVPRTLFIGDGPMLAACKALAERLGVADRFVFAGAIPEADRYLKCAPVVVSPSRWEGMPYLLMKARALGCRILATDCPGNRDVLAGYANWERLALP